MLFVPLLLLLVLLRAVAYPGVTAERIEEENIFFLVLGYYLLSRIRYILLIRARCNHAKPALSLFSVSLPRSLSLSFKEQRDVCVCVFSRVQPVRLYYCARGRKKVRVMGFFSCSRRRRGFFAFFGFSSLLSPPPPLETSFSTRFFLLFWGVFFFFFPIPFPSSSPHLLLHAYLCANLHAQVREKNCATTEKREFHFCRFSFFSFLFASRSFVGGKKNRFVGDKNIRKTKSHSLTPPLVTSHRTFNATPKRKFSRKSTCSRRY